MTETWEYFKDFCVNCWVYDWPQASDGSRLLRCSRCKFISYCSKECQQEHWLKVHSQHCKYLAKKKELLQNSHDPATCPGCMKQTEIGLLEMSRADNPYLGCPWVCDNVPVLPKPDYMNVGLVFAAVPLPFKLGEMSGQFLNKAEHTVSILNHLLHKLKVTKHPAYTINPLMSKHMVELLNRMRQVIWLKYMHAVPNCLEYSIALFIKSMGSEMLEQVGYIDEKLSEQKYQDLTVFRPWDTFHMFLHILLQYRGNGKIKDALRLGLPEMCDDDLKLMVNPDQFSDIWAKMLDSMDGILVPYRDLVKILCGGALNQKCFGCSQDIIVLEASYNVCKVPFCYQGSNTQAYLCGDENCLMKVIIRNAHILGACGKIVAAADENTCDYCFLVCVKVHRCTKCLSKYYCGVKCRDDDWAEVHNLVCKEGQERKSKGGQQLRRQRGIENVDGLVKSLEQLEQLDIYVE